MSIPVFSKDRIQAPIDTPHGEIIYELIGRAAEHGGTQAHSLAHVVLPPGKASLAHLHQVSEESYYILKGRARMLIDGQQVLLSPGDACLLSPGQVHQIFNDAETDLEFLVICVPAWQPGDSFYEQ